MKRCKSCNQSLSNEDRISQLPEALLLQILSLLPTKVVVATSVLSKRWRSLWKLVPNLEFSYNFTTDLETFSDNVCKCLLSYQATFLQSLHLQLKFGIDQTMDIGILMGIAFGLHVRGLVLEVHAMKLYRFPKSLYNCETLETLKLSHHVLVNVPSPVCLKSLRTLHLQGVFYKDHKSVVNLLSGCISLKNLVIHQSTNISMKTFTIAVPSLQKLTLTFEYGNEEYPFFVINSPSLKYLKIVGITYDKPWLIENTPELVEASVINVSGIVFESILGTLARVQRLSLKMGSSSEIKFGSIFDQLIYLELHTNEPERWNLFTLMLDSSPNLQVLKLIGKWFRLGDRVAFRKWTQPKSVYQCLETLVWTDYEGEIEEEEEVANYILKNATRLRKATFFKTLIYPEKRPEKLEELKSVVMASYSCQLVFKETDITCEDYKLATSLETKNGKAYLEDLMMHKYTFNRVGKFTIEVPSLRRLAIFDGDYHSLLVINAPSLKYLEIEELRGPRSYFLIKNAPQLVEAKIDISDSIFLGYPLTLLKRLSLKISPLESFPTGRTFYQLTYLEIYTHRAEWWNLLTFMLDTSPNLQVLKLLDFEMQWNKVYWEKWNQPKNVPECLLLHLEIFVWTGYEGRPEDEKEVAKYILKNASRLKKAVFSKLKINWKERVEMVEELESVVRASNSCQLVFK